MTEKHRETPLQPFGITAGTKLERAVASQHLVEYLVEVVLPVAGPIRNPSTDLPTVSALERCLPVSDRDHTSASTAIPRPMRFPVQMKVVGCTIFLDGFAVWSCLHKQPIQVGQKKSGRCRRGESTFPRSCRHFGND